MKKGRGNSSETNPVTVDQDRGERMEIDVMPEDGHKPPDRKRTLEKEERRKSGRTEIPELPHRRFLEECFSRQIGLPIHKRQTKNIYSFTNMMVSKGYTKVVTTYQGMYYEMEKEQVNWGSFRDRKITIDGDWCWRSEGVTVYNPSRDRNTRTIVPHRFAIKPRQDTARCRLRTDRYYIHVYQTKIGPSKRTLSSKGIAEELKRRFGGLYMPREIDAQNRTTRWDRSRRETGYKEAPRKGGTWRETGWKNKRIQRKDKRKEMGGEDEDRRWRPGSQRKNLNGRINRRGEDWEDQRGYTNSWREHSRGDEGIEMGKIEFHKLGEKLEKLTKTLEKLVQKGRDF